MYFGILGSCSQQHLDEFRLEAIKQAFEAGVEFSTEVFGADRIPQEVTFSSFEDICLILNTIPTTGEEYNMSVYRIVLVLTVIAIYA